MVVCNVLGFAFAVIGFTVWYFTGEVSSKREKICITVGVIGIFILFCGVSLYDYNTTVTETETILITITDKGAVRKNGYKTHRRYYYFYFFSDENTEEKMRVDFSTYDKYEVNDTIAVTKSTTYRIDRDTKEKTAVISVDYN